MHPGFLKYTFLLLLLMTLSTVFAQQKNYLKYRDKVYDSGCGSMDSVALRQALHTMHKVDTNIIYNLAFYYLDLSMIHWKMQWMDTSHIDRYLQYNRRASQLDSGLSTPFYNLAIGYIREEACNEAHQAVTAYKKHPKMIAGLATELDEEIKKCLLPKGD